MNQETPTALGDNEEQLYFYKIPGLVNNQSLTIVGIIDASFSMNSCNHYIIQVWPLLCREWNIFIHHKDAHTLTFSEFPKVRKKYLCENLLAHGGYQTNFIRALDGIQTLFDVKPMREKVTIIFISDGEYSNYQEIYDKIQTMKINKITNVICIGIGKQFPVLLAIQIRRLFNNRDESIPIIFKVDEDDFEKSFLNQFNNMKHYINHNDHIVTKEPIFMYPWDTQEIKYAQSNKWIFTKSNKLNITTQKSNQFIEAKIITRAEFIEIGQQWLQILQVLSVTENISKQARMAYIQYNKITNIQVELLTVAQRRQLSHERSLDNQIVTILNAFNSLAFQDYIESLSHDAANKRLQIGTKLGKYHDRIVKFSALTHDQYLEARTEFIQIIQNNSLKEDYLECSVITMQNMYDVLLEKDLIQGLQQCENQYELIDSFPLIGQSLYIQRSDQSMADPYHIQVIDIAKHHKTIDSISLIQRDYEVLFQTGDGDIEKVNCILPLFSENEIKPYVQSKLFQILMNFNVSLNVDVFTPQAYAAVFNYLIKLLANVLLYLITNPHESTWQVNMLQQIKITFQLIYDKDEEFTILKDYLVTKPNLAMITIDEQNIVKCQDPCKIILLAFSYDLYSVEIATAICTEIVGRIYNHQVPITEYFRLTKPISNIEINIYEQDLRKFYTVKDLIQEFDRQLTSSADLDNNELQLSMENIKFWTHRYSLEKLKLIYQFFSKGLLTDEIFIIILYHCSQFAKSKIRNQNLINNNIVQIKNIIKEKLLFAFAEFRREKLKQYQKLYYELFEQLHQRILPSPDLPDMACMSPDCPYYLIKSDSFVNHKQAKREFFVQVEVYHIIKDHRQKINKQIIDIILSSEIIKASYKKELKTNQQALKHLEYIIEQTKSIFN